MKFTPNTEGKVTTSLGDITDFTRRLKIKEIFHENEYVNKSLVKNKSTRPLTTYNQELNQIITLVENMIPANVKSKDNLTKNERAALSELEKLVTTEEIVMRPADKGNNIVIMNSEYYNDTLIMKGHLNTDAYKMVNPNTDKKVFNELKTLISKHKACLTKDEINFILNDNWKSSVFTAYPKIHKSSSLKIASNSCFDDYIEMDPPTDLKARPVIAGPIAPTQNASKLLEKILTPLVPTQSTYIKDDWDFIKKIPQKLEFECNLFGCDVESLYTSINLDLGIQAITYWITAKRALIPERFTKEFILELVTFIFSNNNFTHKDTMFHQINGASMGGAASPRMHVSPLDS